MTEIVVDIISVGILHIEVLITLGHWIICLRNMGNHMDSSCYLAGLVYQDEPIVYLRPFRSNTMQISPFRKEMTAYGIGRDDDFSLLITFKKVS